MKNRVLRLLLFLSALSASLDADESSAVKQLSLEFYPKWYSVNDITFQGNIGVDKIFRESDWITFYMKPSTTYALGYNFALHGGLGFYYTNNKTINNIKEWRPFIGLSHFTNFTDKWAISSYFRAEERFRTAVGTDNSSKTTRIRLRLRNSYRLNPLSVSHSWHKITLDLEGFKSFNDDAAVTPTYDYDTQVKLGLERSLEENRKIRFELAWKYKSQPREISNSDINTIYFKIQYFPSWGSRLRNRLRDRDIDE